MQFRLPVTVVRSSRCKFEIIYSKKSLQKPSRKCLEILHTTDPTKINYSYSTTSQISFEFTVSNLQMLRNLGWWWCGSTCAYLNFRVFWYLYIAFFAFYRHPTSCASMAEIMSVLFFHTMRYKGKVDRWKLEKSRNKFIPVRNFTQICMIDWLPVSMSTLKLLQISWNFVRLLI